MNSIELLQLVVGVGLFLCYAISLIILVATSYVAWDEYRSDAEEPLYQDKGFWICSGILFGMAAFNGLGGGLLLDVALN